MSMDSSGRIADEHNDIPSVNRSNLDHILKLNNQIATITKIIVQHQIALEKLQAAMELIHDVISRQKDNDVDSKDYLQEV